MSNKKEFVLRFLIQISFWGAVVATIAMSVGQLQKFVTDPQKEKVVDVFSSSIGFFIGSESIMMTVDQAIEAGKDTQLHVVFVDCRTTEEQKESRLPNAISSEEFDKNHELNVNDRYIAYDTWGFRSTVWVNSVKSKNNAGRLFSLEGGILKWLHRGQLVFNSSQVPVKTVNVQSGFFSWAPSAYQATW